MTPIALTLAGTAQTVMATTAGATSSAEGCAPGADVFYSITLTQREVVYVDTFGTTFDTQLRVLPSSCSTAGAPACADNACGGMQSQLVQVLDAGTWVIAVDGASGASGPVALNIKHLPVPGTGPVATIPAMSPVMLSATTAGASRSSTSCGTGAGPEAAWWFATCPMDLMRSFNATTCGGATFDTVLELRSAASTTALACNDDSACGTQSTIVTTIPAGAGLFLLALDGYGASDAGMATTTVTQTTMSCAAPNAVCGGACVDLQTSAMHCGRCSNVCPSGQTCVSGGCRASTGCGAGPACTGGQVCVLGTCRACGTRYTGTTAPFGATSFGGHCYMGFTERMNWTAARDRCAMAGGYLAVPSSAAENDAVRGATDVSTQAWIGYFDMGDSTSPMGFTGVAPGTNTASYHNFGGGEPNNNPGEDCVAYFESPFRPPGITWNDAVCTLSYAYVCEFDGL